MTTLDSLRLKYWQVADRLSELYGYPTWRQHLPPVDELVDCILSQNTSDRNRDIAFDALKARYPAWEAVRDAPVEDVMTLIRPAGLSNTKAPVIQQVLRQISDECGSISLDVLSEMDTAEAKNW